MSFFRSGTDGTKASTHKEKLILLALLALAGVYIPVLVPTTILCAPGEARTLNLLIRSLDKECLLCPNNDKTSIKLKK
jgi:hypothetical protein